MSKISYSAVVLDEQSRTRLLQEFSRNIPDSWEVIAHHMTINMGEIAPAYREMLGKEVELIVEAIGMSELAIAVKVSGFFSKNEVPHITLAVDRNNGGKPFMSNKIKNWSDISNKISITGIVTEVEYSN